MIISLIHRITHRLIRTVYSIYSTLRTRYLLFVYEIAHQRIKTTGIPYIMVARGGRMVIDDNFSMHNGIAGNPIGSYRRCTFFVNKGATLMIGKNVGISQTALICHQKISIGNHVKIGGGVCIYDTDFHSLDPQIRATKEDLQFKKKAPVIIHDHVFIGAFSIILKGVTIGKNSIVGAGSVVTKSIPANQIWAGNPAKFIKNI